MQKAKAAALWTVMWIPWVLGSLFGLVGIPFTYCGVTLIDWAETQQARAKNRLEAL